jgi:hypothetical protein
MSQRSRHFTKFKQEKEAETASTIAAVVNNGVRPLRSRAKTHGNPTIRHKEGEKANTRPISAKKVARLAATLHRKKS